MMSSDIKQPGFNVLWLQSGGCGGCSMSLLCADTSDFFGALTRARTCFQKTRKGQ